MEIKPGLFSAVGRPLTWPTWQPLSCICQGWITRQIGKDPWDHPAQLAAQPKGTAVPSFQVWCSIPHKELLLLYWICPCETTREGAKPSPWPLRSPHILGSALEDPALLKSKENTTSSGNSTNGTVTTHTLPATGNPILALLAVCSLIGVYTIKRK